MLNESDDLVKGMDVLLGVVQKLSLARKIDTVIEIVKRAARELTGADGATFILKEGDRCHYVDEDAIGPLWKGKTFPMTACVSGWAMLNRESAVIEDIYQDARVPADAYRPTFVKSLVMVPIRRESPIGAIGTYWQHTRRPTINEVQLLQSLADSTSIALENVSLFQQLEASLQDARSARDEIARQLSLRDEFISIAAHELKTPLTPLLIQAHYFDQVISKEKEKEKEKRSPLVSSLEKYSEVNLRQLGDLDHLVENLLDVSRIRLNRFPYQPTPDVDLAELIQEVVQSYQLVSAIQIQTVIDPPLIGEWDSIRLKQLLRNLISNAINYGLQKPILIRAFKTGDRVKVSVEDQGIGISPADQIRVFQRYERATSIRSFGGMGLGLYISKQIVSAHGGTIWIESELNHGTRVHVELPLVRAS